MDNTHPAISAPGRSSEQWHSHAHRPRQRSWNALPDRVVRDQKADDGVSTVFACLAVALLMAVTALAIRLGGAMLARQQAETAADLGALAGASGILQGPAAACALAREVVTVNRASMTSCITDNLDLLIEVQLPVQIWNAAAFAHARAGPVADATR